jgi:hypothetical protein
METLEERELTVEMYRIEDAKVEDENQQMKPFEGRMQVSGTTKQKQYKDIQRLCLYLYRSTFR